MKKEHDMIKTITSDAYAGQGGSYLFDPATGRRTRLDAQPTEAESQDLFIESVQKD